MQDKYHSNLRKYRERVAKEVKKIQLAKEQGLSDEQVQEIIGTKKRQRKKPTDGEPKRKKRKKSEELDHPEASTSAIPQDIDDLPTPSIPKPTVKSTNPNARPPTIKDTCTGN